MTDLPSLITRLREADGPSIILNSEIRRFFDAPIRDYTGNIGDAVRLLHHVLPGWWWQVGSCCVSDDARVCPDFNDPIHRKRLLQEFDPATPWDEITDIDLRPPGRPAIALVLSILTAWGERPG